MKLDRIRNPAHAAMILDSFELVEKGTGKPAPGYPIAFDEATATYTCRMDLQLVPKRLKEKQAAYVRSVVEADQCGDGHGEEASES